MAIEWNAENAAHLLNRASFGASPNDVGKAVQRGLDKTLAQLFETGKTAFKYSKSLESLEDLQAWWLRRMITSKAQLLEKLTLFWHNHFATAISKVGQRDLMFQHVGTLREHALGPFRELVGAVARDPAMLIWLDNRTNVAGSPNENWARELMELFTTGVLDKDGQPNYTENDVAEVARAFTGWSLTDDEFVFKEDKHDAGIKTVKGVTGPLGGDDVLDILATDPATARRIPQKLFSFFAYPIDLTDPICDELEQVYVATGGYVAAVLEAVFRHDAFYSAEAKGGRIKGPAEFLAGTLRRVGAKIRGKHQHQLGYEVADLGQSLFNPPSVFGWDEGLAWVTTAGLLARADVGNWISRARDKDHAVAYKPHKLLGKKKEWAALDASGVVDRVLAAIGVPAVAPSTRAALEEYVQKDEAGLPQPVVVDDAFVDRKVRGLLALVAAGPDYQLA